MSPEILEHLKRGCLMSEKKDEAQFSNPGQGGGKDMKCHAYKKPGSPAHRTGP